MPSPMINATLQAAGLSTASNVIAQFIEAHQSSKPFALDLVQLLRFVLMTLLSAPPNYHWQQLLERTFPAYPPRPIQSMALKTIEEGVETESEPPKFSLKNTLTKWFVDCITLGAIFNTLAFLIIMGVMKGQDGGMIMHNIRTETMPIIVAGYKIWPIASIVSFSFIPVHRRIVFLSFVGLLWGIYMSLVAARV